MPLARRMRTLYIGLWFRDSFLVLRYLFALARQSRSADESLESPLALGPWNVAA